ncbi:hypothetical protein [Paenibacillus sinopodophylli]|uniref:hypothetical protein n=1 Tax=Paenibacillus sinopodophylli TaxID=1837342 RepID=UPI00110CD271|nr:hypothetical protein [Paenibacillus sinopodophylli]
MKHLFVPACILIFIIIAAAMMGRSQALDPQMVEQAISIVKKDCEKWCLDSNLLIESRDLDYNGDLSVIITTKTDQEHVASYAVNPDTWTYTSFIWRYEYEVIQNGAKERAARYKGLQFTLMKEHDQLFGSSKVASISLEGKEIAKYRGQLITMFGPASHESEDYEQGFMYRIEAEDTAGNQWSLSAYQGQSGFAIGGYQEQKDVDAIAYALVEELKKREPADFEAEMIDEDTGAVVVYGCKNGECYTGIG